MEAKDRLLTPEQMIPMRHKWEIRDAQDKLSFKAGIKEVVEWIDHEDAFDRIHIKYRERWVAKLKEWE